MRGMFRRTVAMAALGASIAVAAAGSAAAATIVVRPGRLDHFVITAPPTALAGETFLVRIEPFDANGNLITEFPEKGPTFSVGVSSGEASPAQLRGDQLAGGAAVKVADKRAGLLELAVTEGKAATPLAAAQVRILPNRLDHFAVNTPREAVAGAVFQARVIALDAFGNTKTDLTGAEEGLRIDVTGTGTALPTDPSVPPFRAGETILSFEPRSTGTIRIAVQDARSRAAGEGPEILVGPGPLSRFALFAPKAAAAGQPFIVVVAAYDAFGNRVTNYQDQGAGVAFSPSGTGALTPGAVTAGDFRGGEARVTFTYTKAEPLRIAAREQGRDPAGESETIVVAPGEPDQFRVDTPAEAVAGEGFPAEIVALDRFGNLIEDYDLRGLEVLLSADGRGRLRPTAVSPSSFVKGKAAVTLSYDRAESFTVVAALSQEALEKLLIERRRQAASPPEPVIAPEEAARERERAAAERAREEARRAREAAEEQQRAREAAEQAREEARQAREEAAKQAPAPPPAAPKVPPPPAAPPRPVPAAPPPAAAEPARPLLKIVEGVELDEAAGRTSVRIATSGPVSYNASTGSELSKEWIWIELFPVRLAPGVPESLAATSGHVGQVLVRQSDPEKVRVSLQVLPPGISYVVTQQDRAVVVKVVKTP